MTPLPCEKVIYTKMYVLHHIIDLTPWSVVEHKISNQFSFIIKVYDQRRTISLCYVYIFWIIDNAIMYSLYFWYHYRKKSAVGQGKPSRKLILVQKTIWLLWIEIRGWTVPVSLNATDRGYFTIVSNLKIDLQKYAPQEAS